MTSHVSDGDSLWEGRGDFDMSTLFIHFNNL